MSMNKNILLHVAMAACAVLVLALPPLVDSVNSPLNFMPVITTMEGTQKEQNEKIATISHALQGNAIFFLGASEVSSSQTDPYAVFNYLNKSTHKPVVAYGNSAIENIIQFSILSSYKDNLSEKSRIVLLISPDSFYFTSFSPVVLTRNLPGTVFKMLGADSEIRTVLTHFLQNANPDKINHLSFEQIQLRGWNFQDINKTVSYQFSSFCDLIKNFYLRHFYSNENAGDGWPEWGTLKTEPDWALETQKAKIINNNKGINAANHWVQPGYYDNPHRAKEWYRNSPDRGEITAFKNMIKMLKERHVQVVAIVDPLNPWAITHADRFKQANEIITSTLKANQIPYFDMYDQPYQNGWNRDYIHPTDLAWVAMDKFIYEHFL